MKKIILATAFIVSISGFAAAQTAKQAVKKETKAPLPKSSSVKNSNNKTVLKQEASANAKSDSGKLILLIPKFDLDTTAIPIVKDE